MACSCQHLAFGKHNHFGNGTLCNSPSKKNIICFTTFGGAHGKPHDVQRSFAKKNPTLFSLHCSGEFCFHYFLRKIGFLTVQLPSCQPLLLHWLSQLSIWTWPNKWKGAGKVNAIDITCCVSTGFRQELSNKVCDCAQLALKVAVAEFYLWVCHPRINLKTSAELIFKSREKYFGRTQTDSEGWQPDAVELWKPS